MQWRRWAEMLWFLGWAVASSIWCLTAAAQLGPTFDEPIYFDRGLRGWHKHSHGGVIQLGTMPLPADVQTLPLYLWEVAHGIRLDPVNDLDGFLNWMRAGNLVFWWLLLWYARQIGKSLGGPWAGGLAVALLACEPNLLAHAALATTDIAVSACLLGLLYHFRRGREAGWPRRLALPALWFGLAILAKASAVVYGPICLVAIELERLMRAGTLLTPAGTGIWQRVVSAWRQLRPARRDLAWIGAGGLAVAVVYCGCDFRPYPSFMEWAQTLSDGPFASSMVWLAENLRIRGNAFEGILFQIRHNVHGHGAYLLGQSHPQALWYYFPVLLAIKLSLPVLVAPLLVAALRARALTNWACLTALALLGFSLTFRVQIGIRLVLPLVSIGLVGLAAALIEALRSARWQPTRWAMAGACAWGLLWMTLASARVWPDGLCYVNELWGGTARGYELVSDSNYDWGQGLPELAAWQRKCGKELANGQTRNEYPPLAVWYFGTDPAIRVQSFHDLPLHTLPLQCPEDVHAYVQGSYLAASTTLLYGPTNHAPAHEAVVSFLANHKPIARTSTFLIYDFTPRQQRTAP